MFDIFLLKSPFVLGISLKNKKIFTNFLFIKILICCLINFAVVFAPSLGDNPASQKATDGAGARFFEKTRFSKALEAINSAFDPNNFELTDNEAKELLQIACKQSLDAYSEDDIDQQKQFLNDLKTEYSKPDVFGGKFKTIFDQNQQDFLFENIQKYQVPEGGFFSTLKQLFLNALSKISDEAKRRAILNKAKASLVQAERTAEDETQKKYPTFANKSNQQDTFDALKATIADEVDALKQKNGKDGGDPRRPSAAASEDGTRSGSLVQAGEDGANLSSSRKGSVDLPLPSQRSDRGGSLRQGSVPPLPLDRIVDSGRDAGRSSAAASDARAESLDQAVGGDGDLTSNRNISVDPSHGFQQDGRSPSLQESLQSFRFPATTPSRQGRAVDSAGSVDASDDGGASSRTEFFAQNSARTSISDSVSSTGSFDFGDQDLEVEPGGQEEKFKSLEDVFWKIKEEPELLKNLDALNLGDDLKSILKKAARGEAFDVDVKILGFNFYDLEKATNLLQGVKYLSTQVLIKELILSSKLEGAAKDQEVARLKSLLSTAPAETIKDVVADLWDEAKPAAQREKALAKLYLQEEENKQNYVKVHKKIAAFEVTEKIVGFEKLDPNNKEDENVLRMLIDRNLTAVSQASPAKTHVALEFDFYSSLPKDYFTETDSLAIQALQRKDDILSGSMDFLRQLNYPSVSKKQRGLTQVKLGELVKKDQIDKFKTKMLSFGVFKTLMDTLKYQPDFARKNQSFWQDVNNLAGKITSSELDPAKVSFDEIEKEFARLSKIAQTDPLFKKINLEGNRADFDQEIGNLQKTGSSLLSLDKSLILEMGKKGFFDLAGDQKLPLSFLLQKNDSMKSPKELMSQELKLIQQGIRESLLLQEKEANLLSEKEASKDAFLQELQGQIKSFGLHGDSNLSDAVKLVVDSLDGFDSSDYQKMEQIAERLLLEDMAKQVGSPSGKNFERFFQDPSLKLNDFEEQKGALGIQLKAFASFGKNNPFWEDGKTEEAGRFREALATFLQEERNVARLKELGVDISPTDNAKLILGVAEEDALLFFRQALAGQSSSFSEANWSKVVDLLLQEPGVQASFRDAAYAQGLLAGKGLKVLVGEETKWVDVDLAKNALKKELSGFFSAKNFWNGYKIPEFSTLDFVRVHAEEMDPENLERIRVLKNLSKAVGDGKKDDFEAEIKNTAFELELDSVAHKITLGLVLKNLNSRAKTQFEYSENSVQFKKIKEKVLDDMRNNLQDTDESDKFAKLKIISDTLGDFSTESLAVGLQRPTLFVAWNGAGGGDPGIRGNLSVAFQQLGFDEESDLQKYLKFSGQPSGILKILHDVQPSTSKTALRKPVLSAKRELPFNLSLQGTASGSHKPRPAASSGRGISAPEEGRSFRRGSDSSGVDDDEASLTEASRPSRPVSARSQRPSR